MTTQTQRTPGPWAAQLTHDGHLIASTQYGEYVAELNSGLAEQDEINNANAAFIVTACNAHDELVAALRGLVTLYEVANKWPAEHPAWSRARAALAKVTP